jgi:aspartate/methionine/tyrosine aminotransferase
MEKATQYELQLARRMSRLGTETAFEVLNKARALERQGKSVIHLEIGEPDFDTPANVVEAGGRRPAQGAGHTTVLLPACPISAKRLPRYVSRTLAGEVTPEEVVVVPGGKPIIFFTILALIDDGDEVIYPNPGFPIYESMIHYVGGRAVPIHLKEERDFSLDVNELASLINDRTKLIILNSPHNPTGGIMERRDVEQIANLIGDRNIMVLSDEIYSRLLFDSAQHFSIMSVPGMQERTILLDGFSKTYAMTGWRMGYGVVRPTWPRHDPR